MTCPRCGSGRWATWGRGRCMDCERRRSQARRRKDPAEYLYGSTVRRAREKGLPHSLTRDDVDAIMGGWICIYCETPVGSFAGKARRNSATLDRLIPELGYTRPNTVLACHQCNCIKGEHTVTTLRHWADKLDTIIHRQNLKLTQ